MHLRRSLALATGALLLTAPLSSCGFNLATDRINTVSAGYTDRDASVDILNALIVSAEEGSGTFVATFVNNDGQQEATVESLTPAQAGVGNDADQISSFGDFSPVAVPAGGLVNLAADEQGVPVQGEFRAGDVVSMTVQLSGGQLVELDVPVVPNCGEFEGIDGSGGSDLCEVPEPEGGSH